MPAVEMHGGSKTIQLIGDIGTKRAPIEAAGFFFTNHGVIELANRSKTPETRFEFNPDDVALAIEAADFQLTPEDWADALFWHTHPGGGVGPSRVDMNNRVGPIQHLVVSLTPEGYIPCLY